MKCAAKSMLKRMISLALSLVLLLANTATVFAAENETGESLLFEIALLDQADENNRDLLEEIKTAENNRYLDQYEINVDLGTSVLLHVTGASLAENYTYLVKDITEETNAILSEGELNEVMLVFDSVGQKQYEVQIQKEENIVNIKTITVNVAEEESMDQSDTETTEDQTAQNGTDETSLEGGDSNGQTVSDTGAESNESDQTIKNAGELSGTLTSSKSTREYVNRSVTLTANAAGGNGTLEYRFSEKYNGETTVLQEYSTKNTYSFSTKKVGSHIYYVDIKDGKGKTLHLTYTMDVVVHPDYEMTATLTSNKTTSEYENRSVMLTANVTKGYGDYEYKFSETYNGKTEVVREKSEENIYRFTTSGVGTHKYTVEITDSAGQSRTLTYSMTVYEEPESVLSGTLTSSKSTREYVNRSVTLTANAAGGNGTLEYRFSEKYNGETTILQEYSTKNTYSFSTKKVGNHIYYVDIKDGKGKTLHLTYTMDVVVHPDYEMTATLTSNKTTSEYENRSVMLTVNVTKGYGDYEYKFSETYNGKTEVVREKSEENIYRFTTSGVGTHKYTVEITDSAGQSRTLTYSMTVYEEPESVLSGTLTSNKTAKEYVNRSVMLTAKATGGNGTLQYRFSERYNGETTILQEYSTKNTYSFTTKKIGSHTYYVDIKDGKGKTLQLTYTMNVVAHPDYAIKATLTSNKTTTEYVDRSITLTASAAGGYDSNYQYQFSEKYNGKTTVLQEYSTKNTYDFTTEKVGTHTYYVTVKDGQNQEVKASYAMTVKIHPDYNMMAKLTSNKTTNEYSNRSVTLTATVSGGYGDYEYQFIRAYEGGQKIMKDYSGSNKYSFTTGVPGNYTYYVNVKDRSGNIAQASYSMKVVSDGTILKGIDVSAYQGDIDWSKVKSDGVNFAMIRVIENKMGALQVDSKFYENARNATANGISIGVYRYGYAMTVEEARQEAYAVVNALKSSGCPISYPVAYDMEDWDTQGTLTMAERTAILKAFRDVIEANGYKFMIYASKYWLDSMIDMEEFAGEDVWVAQYRDYTPDLGHQYTGPGRVTMWQYSSRGKVSGISGDVDMNIGYMRY